ncbi:vitamin K-dependent gamma-carboxylase [Uranotaenia lowii]|uniref:vitamin K-dependent gamma-carboxylase n=1 Tax=Uranotaenia lowii TaxID=190385 RepID=UPI002478EA7D|nr:vitamin K-dependent gamma-carboxylase [Uranotaenia lowii]
MKNEESEPINKAPSKVIRLVQRYCDHDLSRLRSFEGFVTLMYRPTDSAALGVSRALFGLMMLIDIPDERGGGELDYRWGDPNGCKFPLINGMEVPSYPRMGIIYLSMWLGALGITLGYRFRYSCALFVGTYWYVFLLDKSSWNNHSYLYGLLGTLFLFTNANAYFSIDAWRNKQLQGDVPFWNYFILKYQFFILYFLAGLKKMCPEWLAGYAMTNLSYHWVFTPFRFTLGPQLTDLLIVHWFGCIFDTSVVFFLVYAPTRKLATLFACAFHLMNARLFRIGMFPWTCLTQLPLYYSFSWPRLLLKKFAIEASAPCDTNVTDYEKPTRKRKGLMSLMLLYCGFQLFLPYSHFITKGYNNWTNGLYGYSWDMMVHAWDTVLISIKVVDNEQNQPYYLLPYAFVDNDRWTKHADMAYQFAQCIENNVQQEQTAKSGKKVNISIHFDVWCSLNGRFLQRMFDPRVDILNAKWSPFASTEWSLPLLHQFTEMRSMISHMTKDVYSWSNSSDVLFVADFPGLTMDNYIVPEMDNITLAVLEGAIEYTHSMENHSTVLHKGQRLQGIPPHFHQLKTIGEKPSSMLYTYVNTTMKAPAHEQQQTILPLWQEFMHRYDKYVWFFQHVGNSLLYEIYGVPMPRRVRATPDENTWTFF